jgi:hypothetical protein
VCSTCASKSSWNVRSGSGRASRSSRRGAAAAAHADDTACRRPPGIGDRSSEQGREFLGEERRGVGGEARGVVAEPHLEFLAPDAADEVKRQPFEARVVADEREANASSHATRGSS